MKEFEYLKAFTGILNLYKTMPKEVFNKWQTE